MESTKIADLTPRQERKIAAGGLSGIGLVIVWAAGHLGMSMTAEVGAVIGTGCAFAGAGIANNGIFPLVRRVLYGPDQTPP